MARLLRMMFFGVACFVLIMIGGGGGGGVLAQDTKPGPADFCSLSGTSIAVTGGKVYIYGGMQTYGTKETNDKMVNYQGPNDYLRVIDITQSFNTSRSTSEYATRLELPSDVARMTHAAFWPVEAAGGNSSSSSSSSRDGGGGEGEGDIIGSDIIMMQGVQETSQHLMDNRDNPNPEADAEADAEADTDTDQPPKRLLANQKWTYNTKAKDWRLANTVLVDWKLGPGGEAQDLSPDSRMSVWASAERKGYYLGGENSKDGTQVSSREAKGGESGWQNGLLVYDQPSNTWTNASAAPVPDVKNGGLTYLKTDTDEVLVVFGGSGEDGLYPMTTIHIFSTAQQKWRTYRMPASASAPQPRTGFCTVLVSAPDNGSHAIFVFGGHSSTLNAHSDRGYDDSDAISADSSIWALTLPSLTWVAVTASASAANVRMPSEKSEATCTRLASSAYVLLYGGKSLARPGARIQCDAAGADSFAYLFDLNRLQYTDEYLPDVEYEVPTVLQRSSTSAAPEELTDLLQFGGGKREKKKEEEEDKNKDGDGNGGKMKPGAVAGLVLGVLAVVGLGGVACWWWWMRPLLQQRARPTTPAPYTGDVELEGKELQVAVAVTRVAENKVGYWPDGKPQELPAAEAEPHYVVSPESDAGVVPGRNAWPAVVGA